MSVSPATETSVKLFKEEVTRFAGHPGQTTCTFYQCGKGGGDPAEDYNALLAHFRSKLVKILAVNPWLAGRLSKKDTLTFVSEGQEADKAAATTLIDRVFAEVDARADAELGRAISRSAPYPALNRACLGVAAVGTATELKKSQGPVLKVRLVKNVDGGSGCALIFAMSHYVADGHTYYKILNQLGSRQPVIRLEPQRRPQKDYSQKERELQGPDMVTYGTKCGGIRFIKHIVWNNALKKPLLKNNNRGKGQSQSGLFFVDNSKIPAAKERALQADKKTCGQSGLDPVPFVSTNDLLAAEFFANGDADLGAMTVNFRKYAGGAFADTDAGNYEGSIVYDTRGFADGAGPAMVRRSVTQTTNKSVAQRSGKLPGCCGAPKMVFMSSWDFPCDLDVVLGGGGSEQRTLSPVLHLPAMAMDASNKKDPLKVPIDVWIVFRARQNQLAVFMATRNVAAAEYAERSEMLDGAVMGEGVWDNEKDL